MNCGSRCPHGPIHAAAALLFVGALVGGGCRPGSAPRRQRHRSGPRLPGAASASREGPYSEHLAVHARHFVVQQQIHPPSPARFARLGAKQRAALRRLSAKAHLTYQLFATADRLLIELPANHPLGAMEILLADDTAQLVVFDRERWRYPLSRVRLPDVLDLATDSRREAIKAEPQPRSPAPAEPSSPRAGRATDSHAAEITLTFRPERSHVTSWAIRQSLRWDADATGDATYARALFQLLLPLLQGRSGQLVIESLAAVGGAPTYYERTVTNEAYADDAAAQITGVIVDRGWSELPSARFAAARPGYRLAGRFDTSRRSGAQLVAPDQLARVRSGKRGGKLVVRNRSARAAIVFVDGLPVGWVGGSHETTFTGLARGYYRLFAASPSGVRSWGPRDVYLPGSWTLE